MSSDYDPELGACEFGGIIDEAEAEHQADYAAGTGSGWATSREDIPPEDVPGADVGWPAAVPIRPDRWDEDTRSYRIDWGDTLSGLAATYLGDHARWREIWNEQDTAWRMSRDPDELGVGEWIRMPLDAYATLLAATGRGGDIPPGAKPAQPPPGGYKPVGPQEKKKKAIWPWIAGIGGGGVLAAIVAAVAGS